MVTPHDDELNAGNGASSAEDQPHAQASNLVPLRPEAGMNLAVTTAPMARPEILSAGPDPVALLYSLRRRWLLAGSLAITVGSLLALVTWLVFPVNSEIEALLRVQRRNEPVLRTGPHYYDPQEFDSYRRTQTALIKSNLVLLAALRDPSISQLPLIKSQGDNAVTWLQNELQVDYPGDSEILRVVMVGEEKLQLVKIVNAVIEAYMKEVVQNEREAQLRTRDLLKKKETETKRDLLRLTSEYEELAELAGSPDSEAAKNRLLLAHNELAALRQSLLGLRTRLTDARLKRIAAEAEVRSLTDDPTGSEYRMETEFLNHPIAKSLQEQLLQYDTYIQQLGLSMANPTGSSKIMQLRQQRDQLQDQLDTLRLELMPQIQSDIMGQTLHGAKATVEQHNQEEELLSKQLEESEEALLTKKQEISQFSKSTAELESRRAEIETLKDLNKSVRSQLDRLELELETPARVQKVQPAEPPEAVDYLKKFLLVGFVGLMGFGITLFGVSYWEFQLRRVDSSQQLVEGLGIRVVGTLPNLAARTALPALEKTNRGMLHGIMNESIDGIRTMLIHSADGTSPRVILVTSAIDQEGKTTVASQLAASLARSGRRTLLVDGDLRSPSVHKLFDMPIEDGLSEVLRGEAELDYVIRPTRAVGLWMISAGCCNHETIQELAKDGLERVFSRLKSEFDFIVIDSAPVLSVADTVLIGQQADAAVLTVLRGVSRVPSVYEADERLQSVGIHVLGAVVGGVVSRAHRRIYELPMQATA